MLRYLFLIILFITANLSFSQTTIKGTIKERGSGDALVGVNIYIPELLIGDVSSPSGEFLITDLPDGEVIISFSYIGYTTINKKLICKGETIQLDINLDFLVVEGEEIVISGNFASTQHDNTVKISSISSRQLQQSGGTGLVESITLSPGVDIISKGPGIGSPVIRGLSLSNILFLNNGFPLNNYQFSENHPYMVDEFGVKRVEIIKGPSSIVYGSGAVGGIINIIDEEPAMNNTIVGKAGLSYFGNTNGVSANLSLKGNNNGFYWGILGGGSSHMDYKQGNNEFAPNTRFNRYSIKANVGLIRKKATYKLMYQYGANKLGLANDISINEITTNGRKNQYWFQDLKDHLLITQNKFFFSNFRLDVNLAYQLNKRKLKGSEYSSVPYLVDMNLSTLSFRIKGDYQINDKLKFIGGTQGYYQTNTNFDAPNRILPNASIFDISIYTLAQYHFEKVVVLEAGLRYSFKTIDVPQQEAGGHSHEEEEEEEEEEHFIVYNNNFSNLSGSLGATFNVNEDMLFRVNLASAYRSPNLAELTQYGMHGNRFEMGNINLDIQKNIEADIGFHLHTRHTTIDVSGFYNNIFNYIYLSPSNDTTDEGFKVYQYEQTPSFIYGGEFMLHIHPHPIHWLHIEASYAYIEGKKKNGEYLPLIPSNKVKMGLMFTKDKMASLYQSYFKIDFNYSFEQNKPSEFETLSQSYFLMDIKIGTEFKLRKQSFFLDISATNILNQTYIDHLSTLKDLGIYDMGRSIKLSLTIPFKIKE